MIWQLVKRDPAWRMAPTYMAVAALAGVVVPREGIGMFGFLAGMPWLQCQPERRAADLHAALPVAARDLFLARFLAFLAAVWAPLVVCAAIFVVTGRQPQDLITLAEVGAAMSVIILSVHSSRVRQIAASQWAPAIAMATVCAAAWPASYFLTPGVILMICAVLCAVLFCNIWRQLPLAFEVLPSPDRKWTAPETAYAIPAPQRKKAPPLFAWRSLLRWVFPLRSLFFMPMVVMQALNGQWLYVAVFCIFPVTISMRASWPLALPVRRGALLAAAISPWLALLLFGIVLHPITPSRGPLQMSWSGNRIGELKPPLEFWRIGEAPLIQAPWGETWQPKTDHLAGIAIYNPYGLGPQNSERFFEWQFRRATTAIYGQAIDYSHYKRHRPTVRPLLRRPRLVALNLVACACWVLLLLNVFIASIHWRVQRITPYAQHALGVLFLAQTFLMLSVDLAPGSGWGGIASNSLVNALLLSIAAVLPRQLPALTLIALIPVALLCWTAARLFQGAELPLAEAQRA